MKELQELINYTFKDEKLLRQALTHSSYAYENKNTPWNERLEFLGDAVLEITISEELYKRFPDMSEGDLTKTRAGIVCEGSLSSAARRIGLGACLRLGHGEEMTGGRDRDAILADALEALVGAVFLEAGYTKASDVVAVLLGENISGKNLAFKDYKSILQEIIQKNNKETVSYAIINASGPGHDRTFTAQSISCGTVLGTGVGKSKKEAEQNAARHALKSMGSQL